ncbi:hypothetical protein Moror_8184 [Moniliophthora roreri MCA 2997]|uniref:Uncharacterized protein n=2 Tax=Moniliophthora roreri TaxID=221103 RepID=V2YRM5_MONRO|nr:hypothetical protein Moror_8184 [Moniliophthora roreri MCA 2997]
MSRVEKDGNGADDSAEFVKISPKNDSKQLSTLLLITIVPSSKLANDPAFHSQESEPTSRPPERHESNAAVTSTKMRPYPTSLGYVSQHPNALAIILHTVDDASWISLFGRYLSTRSTATQQIQPTSSTSANLRLRAVANPILDRERSCAASGVAVWFQSTAWKVAFVGVFRGIDDGSRL